MVTGLRQIRARAEALLLNEAFCSESFFTTSTEMPNGKFCQACCWIEYTQNQIETLKKFSLFYFESIFSL